MDATYEFLSFETWRPIYESERKKKQAKPMAAQAYNPGNERLPDVPWFQFEKKLVDEGVYQIYRLVMDCIADARPEDLELCELQKAAEGMKRIIFETAKAVGIVGQQAMGKSLLINALLHRRHLSKTSAAGGACTATAIKYVVKPGVEDTSEIYDAAVNFMDDTELHEIISEHIRRYYHFYFSQNVDPTYREEEERAARTAETFFNLLWNARNDEEAQLELRQLLNAECIDSGELFNKAVGMARCLIQESGADADRKKEFRNMKADVLMEKTQSYIAQHETLPSLWPIVSYVNIAMGSGLLSNAVSIIDLPGMYGSGAFGEVAFDVVLGLGDLNQSRTAATNSIRRKANMEIIVAKSDRVMTEEVVDAQIKQSIRAHGAKNTVLVLTKIDVSCLLTGFPSTILSHTRNSLWTTIQSKASLRAAMTLHSPRSKKPWQQRSERKLRQKMHILR